MAEKRHGRFREKIVPLIKAGELSPTEIAIEVCCDTSLVNYYEKIIGKKAKRYKKGTRLSEDVIKKLMSLRGSPAIDVAKELGIGLTTVYVYWGNYPGEGGKRKRGASA